MLFGNALTITKHTTPSKYRINPKSGRKIVEVISHAASKILCQFKDFT